MKKIFTDSFKKLKRSGDYGKITDTMDGLPIHDGKQGLGTAKDEKELGIILKSLDELDEDEERDGDP